VDGHLHFPLCGRCRYIVHPPSPVCPLCYSRGLGEIVVSGLGVVETFTLNYQAWAQGMEVPFVIAIVTLEEQDDLRLMTNIINIDPAKVKIGMQVKVIFEVCDDGIYLPLFEPVESNL
jgi:uncharacterized OB-fold protein